MRHRRLRLLLGVKGIPIPRQGVHPLHRLYDEVYHYTRRHYCTQSECCAERAHYCCPLIICIIELVQRDIRIAKFVPPRWSIVRSL